MGSRPWTTRRHPVKRRGRAAPALPVACKIWGIGSGRSPGPLENTRVCSGPILHRPAHRGSSTWRQAPMPFKTQGLVAANPRSLAGPDREEAWAILALGRSGMRWGTHGPLAPCKSQIDRRPAPRGSIGEFGRPSIGHGVNNRTGPQPREFFRSFFRSCFAEAWAFLMVFR